MYSLTEIENTRVNQDVTLLASAARTTTQTGSDITNLSANTLVVCLDVTTAGTGSVTILIEGKDAASGKYRTLLQGAAVTTVTTNYYKVGPTIAASANAIAQEYLPTTFRITVTANNANSVTYSVGYSLLRV